ncbi:MAG: hypothetical protein EXS05_17010 [Planctomycetaceae bacterium]|nr:hypothetical protein [Planctomycetaceae bacterium]
MSEAIDKPPQSTWWALLLIPDPLARDSVWIAQADSTSPGTEVFSGMRVTFPLWSPTEGRLSLWLTFTPRFRSLLSILRGWGLWPGDPAATLDVATGAVSWLAVTPQEELQVGHYHLLKHGYNEAWQWYAKAREKMSPAKPPESWTEFARRIGAPENSQLFEFICLQKLGRAEGTLEKYEEFERNFFPPARGLPPGGQSHDPVGALLEAAGPQGELLKRLIRDLYVAEVFLSVDAVNEAVAHFRDAPRTPADDAARFSRALVLAQLLLISGDHDGYLAHVTDVVLPLALRMWESAAHGQSGSANFVLQIAGGLCVAPLFHPDFVAGLNEELVKADVVVWESCRESLGDGQLALAVDLVLRAAARSLGDEILKQAANDRIARNPAGRELFAGKNIDEVVAGWFAQAGEWQR